MIFGGNKFNYFSKNQLALSLLHGSSNSCFSWFVKRKKMSQHQHFSLQSSSSSSDLKKIRCFRLQSGAKVGTGRGNLLFLLLFY